MNRDGVQGGGMSRAASGRALGRVEFVALVGLLMSLVALAIDAMLPALPAIGRDFETPRPNDVQLVIMSLFLGLGFGQLLFGPLSDRIGRKPAIHAGLVLFMIGCLVSIFASTFEIMIAGPCPAGRGRRGPPHRDHRPGARSVRGPLDGPAHVVRHGRVHFWFPPSPRR